MTRINCIPVTELSRQHLVAEYRELPRIRHACPRKSEADIPAVYRLGKGHLKFFYNKGSWLVKRHRELCDEMRQRGYQVNMPELSLSHWPVEAMGDWQPTIEATTINRERIKENDLRRVRT